MALAHYSRSYALTYIAELVALGWLISISLYLIKFYSGADLDFLRPVSGGIIAGLILAQGLKPENPLKPIFIWVAGLMLVQALYRLGLTAYAHANPGAEINLPYILHFGLNRLFELILLSVWLVAILRLIYTHNPDLDRRIWFGRDKPQDAPEQNDRAEFGIRPPLTAFLRAVIHAITAFSSSIGGSIKR